MIELKNRIAPKQSDKTLQERLNEVCKKHGVSTLQDLDWAFCESEKRQTKDFIEADKVITHHKYKRCLAMKKMCQQAQYKYSVLSQFESSQISPNPKSYKRYDSKFRFYLRWRKRWLAIAEKFKEAK